jgi:broad specificity phosphatase PhoE
MDKSPRDPLRRQLLTANFVAKQLNVSPQKLKRMSIPYYGWPGRGGEERRYDRDVVAEWLREHRKL